MKPQWGKKKVGAGRQRRIKEQTPRRIKEQTNRGEQCNN